MAALSLGLGESLQQYLLDVSLHEPDACRALREQTQTLEMSMMISSAEQVQLLLLLAKMLGARNGLEVGTFTGYTSLRLALGMPGLRMTCCDVSVSLAEKAMRNPVCPSADPRKSAASSSLMRCS